MPRRACSSAQSEGSRGQAAVAVLASFLFILLACLAFGYSVATMPAQIPLIAVAAIFVFVVGFFRMDFALLLVIIAMLFSPEVAVASVPKRAVSIRIEDILIVVLAIAWLARAAVFKREELIPRTAVNGWVGFYCMSFLVSTMWGVIAFESINPLKAFFFALKYLEYFFIFYLAAGSITRKKTLYAYLAALLLTFLCVNLYTSMHIVPGERLSAPFQLSSSEPNTLGGYQVLMLCVTLGLFCHAPTRALRLLLGVLALTTVWPFLHTLSRSSYIALVPAYLMLIVYNRSPRKNWLVILLAFAVVLGAVFMPAAVRDRIAYTFKPQYQETIQTAEVMGIRLDPSSSARWQNWAEAVAYWKKSPLFGYGLTGFSFLDGQYVSNLIQLGLVGALAFAFLIWGLQREVLRVYRGAEDWVVKGMSLGFAAGNIGMIVHAVTANTFIIIRIMEPYWFLAAMILIYPRLENSGVPLSLRRAGRRNIDLVVGKDMAGGVVDAT